MGRRNPINKAAGAWGEVITQVVPHGGFYNVYVEINNGHRLAGTGLDYDEALALSLEVFEDNVKRLQDQYEMELWLAKNPDFTEAPAPRDVARSDFGPLEMDVQRRILP